MPKSVLLALKQGHETGTWGRGEETEIEHEILLSEGSEGGGPPFCTCHNKVCRTSYK